MRHLPLRELGYAIGFVVVLAALYVGAYYAMVRRAPRFGEAVEVVAIYSFSADWPTAFFLPIHQIDRRLRPDYWEFGAALDEFIGQRKNRR
jgi:hypothetical protein